MTHRILIVFLLAFLVLTLSSSDVTKLRKHAPPGTVFLYTNIYIDKTPLANIHYLEYQHFLKGFGYNLDCIKGLIEELPEYGMDYQEVDLRPRCEAYENGYKYRIRTKYRKLLLSTDTIQLEIYLKHPAYNYYPLVHVPFYIARKFCEWRTYAVMMQYAGSKNEKIRAKYYKKVRYRLPTIKELEYAATKFGEEVAGPISGQQPLYTVYSGHKKAPYRVNNISEMTNEFGTALGSNFLDTFQIKDPIIERRYSQPEQWLGFRCVCEVSED